LTEQNANFVQQGIQALRQRDPRAARAMFERSLASGDTAPQTSLMLAQSCRLMGDDVFAEKALDAVLAIDARNLGALLMKGDIFAHRDDDKAASSWYGAAMRAAARRNDLPPDIIAGLNKASAFCVAATTRFRTHFEATLHSKGVDATTLDERFGEAIAILAGEKEVFLQSPTNFYYPGLPQTAFYPLEQFAWAKALEAATPDIKRELVAVLASESGFRPYVEGDSSRPNRGHALLNDLNWSAFHLIENGKRVVGNVERCPDTMAALRALPIPRVAGRSPMVLFSVLRAHTHIPPHTGMLNTRLIVHLPLIVPAGCRLRVGNSVRDVVEGKLLIFDDSIEHEAFNDSDDARVILLFEIWSPELSEDERGALTTLFESIGSYSMG
jgi:aspartyl/asparaginyl beta-hydroxylase (cupin superfamily)